MTNELDGRAANNGGTAASNSKDNALMRELRLQRNLKILVTVLGLLIFAGLGGIAWRMMALAKERSTLQSTGSPSAGAAPLIAAATNEIGLELPKGARVVSTSISGNSLAVHYEGPTGAGIAVIDLSTGKRIADVKQQEALPRN
jgi:hypothetical protein